MPKIGDLWIWLGNAYDVIGVEGRILTLREHGSGVIVNQHFTPWP